MTEPISVCEMCRQAEGFDDRMTGALRWIKEKGGRTQSLPPNTQLENLEWLVKMECLELVHGEGSDQYGQPWTSKEKIVWQLTSKGESLCQQSENEGNDE